MKLSIAGLGLSILISSNAFAYTLGGDVFFSLGNAVSITNPHFLAEDGKKLPLNFDYDLDRHNPELDHFCASILKLPLDQIDQSGADIGTEDGMLYDVNTDTFTPVPMPNDRYNSIDVLMCRSKSIPPKMPLGTVTPLPGGGIFIDQPRVSVGANDYPIAFLVENQTESLCAYLGYSHVEKAAFSYDRPTSDFDFLTVNAQLEGKEIFLSQEVVRTQGEPVLLLQSVSCK